MLFDQFDAVRIINLKHRADRRAEMQRELARLGAADDPRVAFFEACRFDEPATFTSPGARGCYHSHLAILEEAERAGHDVLILEDDADFTAGARDFVLPADWQIFYGGYGASNPADLQNSDLAGTHCIAFRAEIIPTLNAYLRALLDDPRHPAIDGAYVWFRRAHPEVRTVFAEPVIAVQRPSRTDIADLRFFDRTPGLRALASLARRLKRVAGRVTFGVREASILAVGLVLIAAALVTATR